MDETMGLIVQAVAAQSDTEREELRALSAAVYPPDPAAPAAEASITWALPTWGVTVRDDDGRVVAFVGIHEREARLDGRPVRVGGIGNVKTHPAARGRGHAGAALRRAAAFLADERAASFGLLVCRVALVPYYRQLGWQPFAGTLLVAQAGATVPFTFNLPMLLPLREPAPQAGTLDLCGEPW